MAVTEVTRRAIIDQLIVGQHWWSGRLEEPDFLGRIYPVTEMESLARRFDSAYGDIWQHPVNNDDWPEHWVFTDTRFGLMTGPNELFLHFLAEPVHPVVRPDRQVAQSMVATYNEHLRHDDYELHVTGQISGRPVYGAGSLIEGAAALSHLHSVSAQVDAAYIS